MDARKDLQFQYISCCSLSEMALKEKIVQVRFNTSHVVVYRDILIWNYGSKRFQYISCCSLSIHPSHDKRRNKCFNTSHVVVYRGACRILYKAFRVSIHLMLQFILKYPEYSVNILLFQYISCCSLSKKMRVLELVVLSFNTSHVVVYLIVEYVQNDVYVFQYISCCSLSRCSWTRCE